MPTQTDAIAQDTEAQRCLVLLLSSLVESGTSWAIPGAWSCGTFSILPSIPRDHRRNVAPGGYADRVAASSLVHSLAAQDVAVMANAADAAGSAGYGLIMSCARLPFTAVADCWYRNRSQAF